MKKRYGLYGVVMLGTVVFAYTLGARQQGIAQEAARCMDHGSIAEQDRCLKDLEIKVGELYQAVKALSEQKRAPVSAG